LIATLSIRVAVDDDATAIWRVHSAAIRETCAGHYPPGVIAAWVERLKPESYRGVLRRGGVVIAEDNARVVGFGQIDLPNGEIQAVYVSPDVQGQGVGAALLAHLEELAGRQGMSRVTLKATINAECFYAAHGWRTTGRDVHKITQQVGLKCIAMEKHLGSHEILRESP
jgi:putative acetyltransferase